MADDSNPFAVLDARASAQPTTSDTPDISTMLDDRLEGGLKGYGPTFVDAGTKYGVDPTLLAAIAMHETGRGTSAALLRKNNAMGISPNDGGPAAFPSVNDSIYQQARTLARNPAYDQWRKSGDIADLGAVYAPVGANNDPRGLNGDWVGGVSKFHDQLSGGAPHPSAPAPVQPEDDANIFAKLDAQQTGGKPTETAPPAPEPEPTVNIPLPSPDNVFAQIDAKADPKNAVGAPIWKPTDGQEAPNGSVQSTIDSADRAIVGGVGSAVTLGGKLLGMFDDKVDDADDTTNPYLSFGHELTDASQAYVTDPAHPSLNKAGGVVGGILPIVASGPAAPFLAAAETGGSTYQESEQRGADPADALAAAMTSAPIVGAATAGLGPVGGKLMGEVPTLATSTWGQLGKAMAWGGLRASARTFWDMAGQNVATGEITNAAVPDAQKQPQWDLLSGAITDALEMAPVGAVTHGVGQVVADANVSRVAAVAGQDKAAFITNTAQYFDSLANNDALTPQEKVAASTQFLNQFSPQAQKIIGAHVQNVKGAMDAIQLAAENAAKLQQAGAPLTAKAKFNADVDSATKALAKDTQSVESQADAEEAALADDLKSTPAPAEPEPEPVKEEAPAVTTAPEAVAEPQVTEPPAPEQPKEESDVVPQIAAPESTAPDPAESIPADRPAEATADEKLPAQPEQGSPETPKSSAPVAGEHVAPKPEPVVTAPLPGPGSTEPAAPITPNQGPAPRGPVSDGLGKMTRPQLLQVAHDEGISEAVAKGATTNKLPAIIRVHRAGQTPTDRDAPLLDHETGALVDPKIDQLPARQKSAVETVIKAAKNWGFRGVKKFIIDTRAPSAVYTRPGAQHFDTVYINPNELESDHSNFRAAGAKPGDIDAAYQEVFSEEFGHLQAGKAIEADWKKAGSPGTFADYYDERMRQIYDSMTPAARKEAAKKYGIMEVDPDRQSSEYGNTRVPAQLGEEYLRQVWQMRRGRKGTEALTRPSAAKEAGESPQTRRLLKTLKSNQPAVRIIQSTVARLKGLVAKLAGRNQRDQHIEDLIDRMDSLTRAAENGRGSVVDAKPAAARYNPLAVAGSARPEEDFDYFSDSDEDSSGRAGSDGGDGSHPDASGQATAPTGEAPIESSPELRAPEGSSSPSAGQPGTVRELPQGSGGKGSGEGSAGATADRGPVGGGVVGDQARGAGPSLTPGAEALLAKRAAAERAATAQGTPPLRPNAGQRAKPFGHFFADQHEQDIADEIERLKDVPVEAHDQERYHGLSQTLARLQFHSNDAARDIAANNAFVKVMLAAKRWVAANGSLEAEDEDGHGFGGRTIIQRSLLDDGRKTSLQKSVFAGEEVPGEVRDRSEQPADEGADGAEAEEGRPTQAFDPSEDDPEKIQAAFGEPISEGSNVEGVSLDTPRKRAQDAAVEQNVSTIRQTLSPYQRRLLQLWHESAEEPDAKYPKWVSAAQKELGVNKEQALQDFHETVRQMRDEVASRGLTRDDFTRVASSPRREPALSKSPRFVYLNGDGEKDASIEHDARGNLGRALGWAGNDGRGVLPANPAEFADRSAQNGFALHPEAFNAWLRTRKEVGGGTEHTVYRDAASGRVIKVTHPDLVGDGVVGQHHHALSYLRNLDLQNRAFDDDIQFHGTVQGDGVHPQFVTSQRAVRNARQATDDEVHDYLTNKGFVRDANHNYFHPEKKIQVTDFGGPNMLARDTKNGVEVYPIDPQMRYHGADYMGERAADPAVTASASPEPEAFADRVANDDRVHHLISEAVYGRQYTPIPNEFTADEALKTLDTDGVDKSYQRVMEPDAAKSGLDARQRVTLGQQLMMRLQKSNSIDDLSRAVNVAERLSTFGKDLGQAVQAFSIWSRLTPAGVLTKYARILKPVIDKAREPFEKTIDAVKQTLATTRQTATNETLGRPKINEIVDEAERLSDAKIERENAKPIWQRYQEETAKALATVAKGPSEVKAKGALQEFGERLTQNLKSFLNEKIPAETRKPAAKLSAEAKLGEIYHNEPEYRHAWDVARQHIEEKFKDDPATLTAFHDALDRIFKAPIKLHDEALRDELDSRSSSFRKVAKDGYLETTKSSVVNSIVDRMKLTDEQGDRVRRELGDRFDALHKQAVKANADAKARSDAIKQAKEDSVKQGVPLWERYSRGIADSLAKLVGDQKPSAVKPALEEFAGRVRANLKKLATEDNVSAALAKPSLTAEQRFGEIYRNFPEYQKAWDDAKASMLTEIGDDAAKRQEFESTLAKTLEAPFDLQDSVIKNALKQRGSSLRDLVREWSGKQNATRDGLIKDIQSRLALDPAQAKRVGDVLANRYKIMLDQARAKELARVIKSSGKPRLANQPKTIASKILEAVNLGAADDEATWSAIADAYKLPKFDPQVAKALSEHANEIQKMLADGKEGFQTDRKTSQMMNILATQEDKAMPTWKKIGAGQMAVFYGNLFGPATIVRKSISEVSNFVAEISSMGIAQMRHGDAMAVPRAFAGGIRGLITRGATDAASIMRTGYGLRTGSHSFAYEQRRVERGQIYSDVPVLKHLNKPLSLFYKPVGRILQAGAAFFYAGANEARANMLAYRMAKADMRSGATPNEGSIRQRMADLLGTTAEAKQKAIDQAAAEGLTGRDAKLRAAELIEQSRPEDLRKDAAAFGARATYMQEPEGLMGAFSDAVQTIGRKFPAFRLLVPVHRVVSNVFNNFLSYTPFGISGAIRMAREGDMDTAAQQYTKVALGALSTIGAAALFSNPNGPQLYGSGPTDFNKNKQLRDSGWIPYSIKLGDHYVSYREWPISLMLASVGNYMDGARYNGMAEKDASTRLASALLSTGRFSLSSSWISSASNLLTAFTSSSDKQTENSLKYAVGSTAGSLVPFNQKTLQTVDKLFDSTQYSSSDIGGMLASQVAFARRLGQPTLNALGEPVTQNPFSAFESADKKDPVWNALASKGVFIPDISKSEYLGDRTLTDDEHYRLTQESGATIRQQLENGGLDKMADMEPEAAQEYLNGIAKAARAPVKAELRAEGIDNGTILSDHKSKGHR